MTQQEQIIPLEHRLALEELNDMDQDSELASANGTPHDHYFVSSWLLNSYQVCPGNVILRHDVYLDYEYYCKDHGVVPINAASLGKIIKGVFPKITTRRLGTRGNSKYHYCGIQKKTQASEPFPVGRVELMAMPSVDNDIMKDFINNTQAYLSQLLQLMCQGEFDRMESFMISFWHCIDDRSFLENSTVLDYVHHMDTLMYDRAISILMPNFLESKPVETIQKLRILSRKMQVMTATALETFPDALVKRKVECKCLIMLVAHVFGQQVRRFTTMNHLSQAASNVLNGDMQQLAMDWSDIDFEAVREQATWVCDCPGDEAIDILQFEVKKLLMMGARLDMWMQWLEGVVSRFLDGATGQLERQVYNARQVIMKWSFYTNMCIRDLTLRSSSSFGHFHILRLLFDEFVLFVVEQRIAHLHSQEAALTCASH